MKKTITSIVMILISIMCMANFSYAAGAQLEATIEITPSATEVLHGDEVVFTFVTKNIVNAESGKIYAIGGKLVYDTEFFELGTTDMTVGDTGVFNSTKPVSDGETNGTITLKVKDNATGSGEVQFTELIASDGRLEDMETLGAALTPDQKFTIKIKQSTEDEGEQNPPADDGEGEEEQKPPADDGEGEGEQTPPADDGEGEGEQTPPADDGEGEGEQTPPVDDGKGEGEQNPPANDEKDDTTVNKEIPKAGASTILTISILVVAVMAMVIHKKNQKYEDIK